MFKYLGILVKHIILSFILLISSISVTIVQAEEADLDVKELALLEGAVGLSSIAIASDPKAWGTGFVALSPLFALAIEGEFSWPKYLAGIAVISGVGAWLISKEDEPSSTVAKQMFLGYNAVLIPVWFISKNSTEEASQNVSGLSLRIDPVSKQVALGYILKY